MNNNSRFFQNTTCEYYPCHKGVEEFNCLFCYCPFYAWEHCPGINHYIEKKDGRRIKVCTDCVFPHKAEHYDRVIEILKMGQEEFRNRTESESKQECKFYGIGVGPGEPELVTKKADRLIRGMDVLILPAKDRESCRAYTIARQAVPEIEKKECLFIPFPMSMKEPELSAFHEGVAKQVCELLEAKKSVGFLTIGDVSIYSTFGYVEQLVKEAGYATEYVSGISSFSAAAARLGISLTLGSEQMHVIPGSANVDEALKLDGTLIFMKSGKRLMELKQKLAELSKTESIDVRAVSNCGMDNEAVAKTWEDITEESGYLTVVIVRRV